MAHPRTPEHLSIVVIGASGDLARKKIYPALFALFCQGFLPEQLVIMGFARSPMGDEAFRERIAEHLTCRYVPGEHCADKMAAFLSRCYYVSGQYQSSDAFLDLYMHLQQYETTPHTNRMFYFAIPPSVFLDVSHALGDAGFVRCGEDDPWSRVVIEKPFGHDRRSSDMLTHELARVFSERKIFRIDHYLGKEVIQNLLVLRFANLVFEPMLNRDHVDHVLISWGETHGVEGRGGYFDSYGIIRDVMQNHLLQMLALTAMEPPRRFDSGAVRDQKVAVLKHVAPATLDDLVVGQYGPSPDGRQPSYVDDPSVPEGSRTPTYAAVRLRIDNARWDGVPFIMQAGKALDRKMTEIRVRFRHVEGNLFGREGRCPDPNELVIRVQPDEAIMYRITSKVPGVDMRWESRDLDLQYHTAFSELIPDAYEDLLLDVIWGEKSLFIRSDELAAAWDVFTPVLHELDEKGIVPEPYEFGSAGPAAARRLLGREP